MQKRTSEVEMSVASTKWHYLEGSCSQVLSNEIAFFNDMQSVLPGMCYLLDSMFLPALGEETLPFQRDQQQCYCYKG